MNDIDEIIQLMRTCSIAKVRAQLELAEKKMPELIVILKGFYKAAAKRDD